jgi:hypothetical protein
MLHAGNRIASILGDPTFEHLFSKINNYSNNLTVQSLFSKLRRYKRVMRREATDLKMEFHGRHPCLSSQCPSSSSAANEEGDNDTELEMVAQECTNGAAAADAEEARKNMSLDSSKFGPEFFDNLVKCIEDDNLQLLQRQKDRIERQVFFVGNTEITSCISRYGALRDCFRTVIHFDIGWV